MPTSPGVFAWALWMYWWIRGRLQAGRLLVEQVLALDLTDSARSRALLAAGAVAEPGTAIEEWYAEAVGLAERSGEREAAAGAALGFGLVALQRRDAPEAERRLRGALRAAAEAGTPGRWYAMLAQVFLGAARRFQGDPAGAVVSIEDGLAAARRCEDRVTACAALYNLAHARLALGDQRQAREHLADAALLCRETGDLGNLSYVLDALAVAGAGPERVAVLVGAAEALREAIGSTVYG
jgi:tetratricopeptide (TPR) repeat protein